MNDMLAAILAVTLSAVTPDGLHLRVHRHLDNAQVQEMVGLAGSRAPESMRHVYAHPELSWVSVRAEVGEGPLRWPKGQTVALTLPTGKIMAKDVIFLGPNEQIAFLGWFDRIVPVEALFLKPGKKGVEAALLVAFPSCDTRSAIGMEVVRP